MKPSEFKEALESIDSDYSMDFIGYHYATTCKALRIADRLMEEPSEEHLFRFGRAIGLAPENNARAYMVWRAMCDQLLKEVEEDQLATAKNLLADWPVDDPRYVPAEEE